MLLGKDMSTLTSFARTPKRKSRSDRKYRYLAAGILIGGVISSVGILGVYLSKTAGNTTHCSATR